MGQYSFAAVLFDMDGVVIDNTALNEDIWMTFTQRYGLNPPREEIQATNGRRAVDGIRLLFGTHLDSSEIVRLATEREDLYRQHLLSEPIKPVSGVREFLEALGRLWVPRVLATSATLDNAEVILSRLEIAHCFESIVSAENVLNGKPDPEVYLKASACALANPKECLVIEDAIPGVLAARAAGASCLGLMTSQSEEALRAAGADWVTRDFLSLPERIQPLVGLQT